MGSIYRPVSGQNTNMWCFIFLSLTRIDYSDSWVRKMLGIIRSSLFQMLSKQTTSFPFSRSSGIT